MSISPREPRGERGRGRGPGTGPLHHVQTSKQRIERDPVKHLGSLSLGQGTCALLTGRGQREALPATCSFGPYCKLWGSSACEMCKNAARHPRLSKARVWRHAMAPPMLTRWKQAGAASPKLPWPRRRALLAQASGPTNLAPCTTKPRGLVRGSHKPLRLVLYIIQSGHREPPSHHRPWPLPGRNLSK